MGYDIKSATTTDIANSVVDYSVDSDSTDYASSEKESYWTFPEADENIGYYNTIPELSSAIDKLSLYTAGLGYTTENTNTEVTLKNITGWGEDSFQSICQNLIRCKKVFGDGFAEIIRNEKSGTLINLKPISPERIKLVLNPNGTLKRYDYRQINGKWKPFELSQILHVCNNRFADEIHGKSVIPSLKWVIDALHEALEDERLIKHRDRALGIIYYKTDDEGKITYANTQIEKAVKNGEMLGLPEDTAEIKEIPLKSTGNRIEWIRFLQSSFYQVVGTPKIIATSEDYTEAGGKVGYLTFEAVWASEQRLLEQDLWNQVAIKVTFKRPPSLMDNVKEDEIKNASQTGFQSNDVTAGVGE